MTIIVMRTNLYYADHHLHQALPSTGRALPTAGDEICEVDSSENHILERSCQLNAYSKALALWLKRLPLCNIAKNTASGLEVFNILCSMGHQTGNISEYKLWFL